MIMTSTMTIKTVMVMITQEKNFWLQEFWWLCLSSYLAFLSSCPISNAFLKNRNKKEIGHSSVKADSPNLVSALPLACFSLFRYVTSYLKLSKATTLILRIIRAMMIMMTMTTIGWDFCNFMTKVFNPGFWRTKHMMNMRKKKLKKRFKSC